MRQRNAMRQYGFLSVIVTACLFVGIRAESRGEQVSAQAGSNAACTVALLPAEGSAPQLEVVFGEVARALESGGRVTVLARQEMDRIIREHELSMQGLVRRPTRQGRMLGAELIVHGQAVSTNGTLKAQILCLDVRTGNAVAETSLTVGLPLTPENAEKVVADAVRLIHAAISAMRNTRNLPTAAVLGVLNGSESERLNFLEEEIRRQLEEQLREKGYYLLQRQRPDVLGPEATLNVSGMVRPDAEVLAEAADVAVWGNIIERPDYDLSMADTPIVLSLSIRLPNRTQRTVETTFTLADRKAMKEFVLCAMPEPGAARRRLTREEASVEAQRMLELFGQDHAFWSMKGAANDIARRIVYLDPTAKDAYLALAKSLFWNDLTERREKLDNYIKYLSFPRTDRNGVRSAFGEIVFNGGLRSDTPLWRGREEEYVRWMHEYVTWENETCRSSFLVDWWPREGLLPWWDAHPKERLRYCQRLLELAGEKPADRVELFNRMAKCSEQLGDRNSAAKYRNRSLAEERRSPFCRGEDTYAPPTYGHDYWGPKDADAMRLGERNYKEVTPEPVSLAPHDVRSTGFLHATASGLWLQGVDAADKAILLHSTHGANWRVVATPDAFVDKPPRPFIDVAECNGYVVFSTAWNGCWVYRMDLAEWTHLDMTQGLPSDECNALWTDRECGDVWIAADSFLVKFHDGRLLGYRHVIPGKTGGMWVSDGNGMFLSWDGVLFRLDKGRGDMVQVPYATPDTVGTQVAANYLSSISSRCHSDGAVYWRKRMAVRGGDLYFAADGGVVATDTGGRVKLWAYPSTFCYTGVLGTWVEGNCPLPECGVKHVVADDKDETLLWVTSAHSGGRNFITAFDTKRRMFSSPRKVSEPFDEVQSCGDSLYLTGAGLRRLSKKLWTTDRPMRARDDKPLCGHATNTFGRAAAALFRDEEEKAVAILREYIASQSDAVHERFVLADILGGNAKVWDPNAAVKVLAPLLKDAVPMPARLRAAFKTSKYLHATGRLDEAIEVVRPFLGQYMDCMARADCNYPWYEQTLMWSVLYRDVPVGAKIGEIKKMARLCRGGYPQFLTRVALFIGLPEAFGNDPYWIPEAFPAAEFSLMAGDGKSALAKLDKSRSSNLWYAWNCRDDYPSQVYDELMRREVHLLTDPPGSELKGPDAITNLVEAMPELNLGSREWEARIKLLQREPGGFDAYRGMMALVYGGSYSQALNRVSASDLERFGPFTAAECLRLAGTVLKYSTGNREEAGKHFLRAGSLYTTTAESLSGDDEKSLCLFLAARTSLMRGRPDVAAYQSVVRKFPDSVGGVSARCDLAGLNGTNEPPVLCHGMDGGKPVRPGNRYDEHEVLVFTLPKTGAVDYVAYHDSLDFVWGMESVWGIWSGQSLHYPGSRPRPGMGYLDFFKNHRFVTRRFYHFYGNALDDTPPRGVAALSVHAGASEREGTK